MPTPFNESVNLTTANTNRNGTGTIVDIVTAGAGGADVYALYIAAQGTTTDGKIHLYIKDSGTYYYIGEYQVTGITPSTTVARYQLTISFTYLKLANAQALAAATEKTETFTVTATGVQL